MKYKLTGMHGTGYADIDIAPARFLQIRQAKSDCLFALELEEKFALLVGNYLAFENELLRQAQESLIWAQRTHSESMERRLSLDRHVVNLLTACRLYLDQSDHGISSIFGNPSDTLSAIIAFKNKLYENNWGYRFMEALRNHVQHAGLPVNTISRICSRSHGKGGDYAEYRVIPKTRIRDLRENPKFKANVLDGLPEAQKDIDLRVPIREYMACLFDIHQNLRDLINGRVITSRTLYETAVAECSTSQGQEIHFPMLVSQDDVEGSYQQVDLVTHFLGYYDELIRRNTVNKNIRLSFSSNSSQYRA